MKRIIFKVISITLIIAHLSVVCLRDVSFAQSEKASAENANPQQTTAASSKTGGENPPVAKSEGNATKPKNSPSTKATSASLAAAADIPAQAGAVTGLNLAALKSFQNDPFTGRATVSLPIAVPAGRRGMQPSLALSYSSQKGNGLCGLGWDLEIDSIQRSTKRGVPNYNFQDTFVASSRGFQAELVNISGWEYRTKIEGEFLRFSFDSGTSYWIVTDKSGTKYYFGSTTDSRQTNSYGIFSWYLSKVVDVNGNYMEIAYTQDQGQIYPFQIKYTGNQGLGIEPKYVVNFKLENRPDVIASYRSGSLVKTNSRISEITVGTANNLIYKYVFGYTQGLNSSRSLLSSVTQYSGDGKIAFPPLTFTYRFSRAFGYTLRSPWQSWGSGFGGESAWQTGVADLNGDGLLDFWQHSYSNGGPMYVWLSTGSGLRSYQAWGSGFGGESAWQTGIADLNGDGLSDFWQHSRNNAGDMYVWLSTGTGLRSYQSWGSGFSAENAYQTGVAELNGDGLSDFWQHSRSNNGYMNVWLSTGTGLNSCQNWGRGFNAEIAWQTGVADLNGDGLSDFWQHSRNNAGDMHVWLCIGGPAFIDLLERIQNGIGGLIYITYASSTQYPNTGSDNITDLPFPVPVVSSVTTSDGQSQRYTYKDGFYHWREREFRGFGYVKVIDAEGNTQENYFKQDDIYKGKLYKQEIRDRDGNLYSKVENTWQHSQPYPGVYFPYLTQTDNYTCDGNSTYKQTRAKFEYDTFGNPTKVISEGDVDLTNDEKTQVTEYTYNTADWLLAFPKHAYLLDAQGNKVSEKWFYYDNATSIDTPPVKGLLTKEENWLSNPLTTTSKLLPTTYTYDEYGNPKTVTDSLDRTTIALYDTVQHCYPIQVTNVLGQTVKTVYYGINESPTEPIIGSGLIGQVKYTQDPNNQKTYNIYDTLGRLIKVIGPNDTPDYPGVTYEYDLSTPPIKVTKRVKIDYTLSPKYLNTYSFYDGLGRLIQSKSPAQDVPLTGQPRQIISDIVKFDSRGQIKESYFPYFVNASSHYEIPTYTTAHTTFNYDCLGRLIQSTNPDLTYSTINYSDWVITRTDENSHYKTEYYDAYGKVIKIEEHNGTQAYTTTYEYDTQGNLTRVTDNQGNITQIWYDSLGRKIKMDDPDMGVWTYEYDGVGNLKKQTDAKGQVLEFTYDSLNRLTGKQANGQTLVIYQYDDATKTNCIGRLSKITDLSGSTEFFYDNLGREIKSTKTVTGSSSFTVERTYDALDRLITLKYPDNSVVKYEYNPQGIEKIYNLLPTTYDLIKNIDYSPTGQITKIRYGNGTETSYTYEPNTLRLTNLLTQSPYGKIQDLNYQFDNVGNIKNITDYVNTATQSLLYDDLDRLIQAQGSYGSSTYDYDSIGNMIYKEGINLIYGNNERLPHAVTQFGSILFDYDNNGNMLKKGNLELTYDVENRLTKVEDKSTAQPQTLTLTLTPGWNFISLPIQPQDPKIASVLSQIAGKYDQVSRYNSTSKTFEHYAGNSKYDQFDAFEYGKGYQIYITDPGGCTLTVTGTLPQSATVQLKAGYNLISRIKTTETPVEQALSPLKIGIDYSKVLHYNKQSLLFEIYDSSQQQFSSLKPGESYYLYCLKDNRWTITNSSKPATTFVYDGDGGRVSKVTRNQTTETSTTYIGSLFEKDSDGKFRKHIFSGANRIASLESTGNTYYYHSDHLGSSNVLTDTSGAQIGHTEFTPYGSTFKQTGSYDPKHKFTGKELDSSTGLYFYGARYYDPELGRFITADPTIQHPYDPQDFNRYAYCRNNPLNYIDPTGLGFWKNLFKAFKNVIGSFTGGVTGGIGGAFLGGLFFGPIGAVIGGYLGASAGGGIGNSIQHGGNVLAGMGMGVVNGLMAAPFVFGGYALGGPVGAIAGAMLFSGGYTAAMGGGFETAAISGIVTGTYASAGYGIYKAGGDQIINKGLEIHYRGSLVGGPLGNALDNTNGEVWHATTKKYADSIMKEGMWGGEKGTAYVFDPNEVVNGVRLGDMKAAQLRQALALNHNVDTIVHIPRNTVALQPAPTGAYTGGYASQATIYGVAGKNVGPCSSWYTSSLSANNININMQVIDPTSGKILYSDQV